MNTGKIPGYVNRVAYIASWVISIVGEKTLWWLASKVLGGGPQQQSNDRDIESGQAEPLAERPVEPPSTQMETVVETRPTAAGPDEHIDVKGRETDPVHEYMRTIARTGPEQQRNFSTQLFLMAHNGTVTMDDITPTVV